MATPDPYLLLLSFIVFLPAAGALLLTLFPASKPDAIRFFTLGVTILVLLPVLWMALGGPDDRQFDIAIGEMQDTFSVAWIPSFDIYYSMGVDGISFPLLVLTALVSALAMGASWSITKHVKGYCILFLLLETGMLGVFLALDFFLFYVFWEVMLLPMYFLIGVWGGPRKEYAAIKFFLYTLLGSVLMLIAILMLYFNSDLRTLAKVSDFNANDATAAVKWDDLHISPTVEGKLGYTLLEVGKGTDSAASIAFHRKGADAEHELTVKFTAGGDKTTANYAADEHQVQIALGKNDSVGDIVAAVAASEAVSAVIDVAPAGDTKPGDYFPKPKDPPVTLAAYKPHDPIHTFNILALAAMGQHTDLFDKQVLCCGSLQTWAFVLLFIGFAIKVPAVPVHTWLPDAHVEAPTPISMILAGVLLKMGGYGIIRICYPICPHAGYDLAWLVCTLGVLSMVYGAFAALAQKDFKRMVAYSSVSHMGYVVLGLGVWSATAGNLFNPDYWNMGVKGAMFQMIGHGISSAGMFFMVGVIYDRVHHRNLNEFGGLFGKMPVYTALAMGLFFAGLGLPGLCGFIGEVLVVLSVWNFSQALAVISAFVVILTAGYILWAVQRVYLGAEYKGPHAEELRPITPRELAVAVPLFVLAILFGVLPHQTVLKYMDATIDRQVNELAEWTARVKEPQLKAAAEAAKQAVAAEADPPAVAPVREVSRDGSRQRPAQNAAPEVNETSAQSPVAPVSLSQR